MPKPYRSDGKKTMSPVEVKRAELAKKKAQIIRGQNDRIAYGNALRVTTNKNGVQTSNAIGL